MFNKCVELFGDREFLFGRMFIFGCNQVFSIVPVGLSTHAPDKVLKRFKFAGFSGEDLCLFMK